MAYDILSLESARCVEDETRAPLKRCLNGGPDRPEKGSLMIWKDCGQGVAEAASMSLNPVQPPKDSLAALEFEGPKWVDRAKKGHPAEFQGKNLFFFAYIANYWTVCSFDFLKTGLTQVGANSIGG